MSDTAPSDESGPIGRSARTGPPGAPARRRRRPPSWFMPLVWVSLLAVALALLWFMSLAGEA